MLRGTGNNGALAGHVARAKFGARRTALSAVVTPLVLLCITLGCVNALSVFIAPPAWARDDDYERQRERAERERERYERYRERAQREAEKAQREADKAQRERERAAREVERAARESAKALAEAQRQGQQVAPQYQPNSPSGTSANSGSSNGGAGASSTRQALPSSDPNGKSGDSGNGRSSKYSDERDDDSDAPGKTDNKSSDKSKTAEKSKDTEKGRGASVAIVEDDTPPATLFEMLNIMGKGKGPDKGTEKGQGPDKAQDRDPGQGKGLALGQGSNGNKPGTSDKSDDDDDHVETGALPGMASPGSAKKDAKTPAPAAAAANAPKKGKPDFELLQLGTFRPREIMASRLDAKSVERAKALGFKAGASVSGPGQAGTVSSLTIPAGLSETQALELLRDSLPDANFSPNHVYKIITPASEEQASSETKVAALGPDAVPCKGDHCFARDLIGWKPHLKSCARRVKVGLIDTSFDTSHPAFAGRRLKVGKFAAGSAPSGRDWHGTAVLSVLAGDASSAAPGLVPDADFLLASTFGSDKDGNAVADSMAVLKALSWLDAEHADIINMSFSGPANDMIEAAISNMADKGVIFVAAAGNRGVNGPASYPAAYKEVIAVTAVGKDKQNYRYANRGDYVDIAAPGVNVWAALPEAKVGYRTGTSFAAPFVTGLIAAMPAARKNITDKYDVLSRVSFQDLGEPGRDPVYGEGLPIAPKTCDEVGGVASLPWTQEAKRALRMGVGAPKPAQAAAPAVKPAAPQPATTASREAETPAAAAAQPAVLPASIAAPPSAPAPSLSLVPGADPASVTPATLRPASR